MSGWILLSRNIKGHWIWKDPERLKWWIDLILMANFEPTTERIAGMMIICERGQFATTQSGLSKIWNADYQVVYRFLKKLERDGMVKVETNRHWTRITICKYDQYQVSERPNENPTIGISGSYDDERKINRKTKTQIERPMKDQSKDQMKDQSSENQEVIEGERKTERKTDERQIETLFKEINNNNISTTIIIGAQEKNFIEELKGSQSWLELMSMRFFLGGVENVRKRLDEFAIDQECRGTTHKDLNDVRRHFNDWLRIRLSYEQKEKENAGNRKRTEDKRRGNEVTATSGQDYEGEF